MIQPPRRVPEHTALLVVDMQRDFMPGGALPVPGADTLFGQVSHYVALFGNAGAPIFFSRDWHAPDHCSFVRQGGRWPPHCIAGTAGAEFPAQILPPDGAVVISKGTDRDHDAYSAFEGTALAELLHARGVEELWVAGVALDYCVRATVLDALRHGFRVMVLVGAVRAVDLKAGDGDRALQELLDAGARAHAWAGSHHRKAPAAEAGHAGR
jgi:nicotinamidase/pyrazinamidase